MDWITAMLGFEPPLPPGATVVEVTGLTVVVVVAAAGAVVVGVVGVVVAGATVVALASLACVPWELVGAPEAASAEAGRAPRSRKRPARSAKDAAHLRGRTTSLLGLELIRPDDDLPSGCVRGRRGASAGTREVYHALAEGGKHRFRCFWASDQHFYRCWNALDGPTQRVGRRVAACVHQLTATEFLP
jgi:hypothetical protein